MTSTATMSSTYTAARTHGLRHAHLRALICSSAGCRRSLKRLPPSRPHEQGGCLEPYLFGAQAFAEVRVVFCPHLEAEPGTILAPRHTGVRAGVPDVGDHLATIHASSVGHAARDPGEVAIAQGAPVLSQQPHLPAPQLVELLLRRAVRHVLEQRRPLLGAQLDVRRVRPYHLAVRRSYDRAAVGNGDVYVAVDEVEALADAITV